jgi:hypothetical protein
MTCAEACPGELCENCVHLPGGSTQCASQVGLRCDLNEFCATDGDCPSFRPTCMIGVTDKATNDTVQYCGRAVGSGVCALVDSC